MNEDELNQELQSVSPQRLELWVGAAPWFKSSVFLCHSAAEPTSRCVSGILFDADGHPANELSLEFPRGSVGIVELEQFLGSLKLESGMQHGRLHIVLPNGVSAILRVNSNDGAAIVGEPVLTSFHHGAFFPVLISEERRSLVSFINPHSSAIQAKCRFFAGSRAPECAITVPAGGSRVIVLESSFPEFAEIAPGKTQQGYLRITTKSPEALGVQLIERVRLQGDHMAFSSVS